MAGSALDRGDGLIGEINVTPLVDIILVILIIFMVSADLIASRGLVVERPASAHGAPVATTIAMTIDADRVVWIDGVRAADEATAARALRAARDAAPGAAVLIDADASVPHGRVVAAVDLVLGAGIADFAIAVRP